MNDKNKDKTEKMCEVIKKQKTNKFTGKMEINFFNGVPETIKKTSCEKV